MHIHILPFAALTKWLYIQTDKPFYHGAVKYSIQASQLLNIVLIFIRLFLTWIPLVIVFIATFFMYGYSSLTWCAVISGSNRSPPQLASWEFLLDPSSQDSSQTGTKITENI